MTGDIEELEALVLRLKDQGATEIGVTLDKLAITVRFTPGLRVMPPPSYPIATEGKQEQSKEDTDLAYWSSND